MKRCDCDAAGVPLFNCARCGAAGHGDRTRKGGADCAECEGSGELKRREDGAPMECWYCDGTGREPDDIAKRDTTDERSWGEDCDDL